jgi:tetratricopeptide (TPR) repeat protein
MIENKANKDLERRIDLYVNGRLNAEQTDELWAELIEDDYYLDYMKSVANVKAVIDRQKSEQPTTKIYSFQRVAQYATAAAVILIIGLVGFMNFNTSSELGITPVEQIGLDVVRDSSGVSETVTNEVIREAIRLATEGEVEQAISLLESELDAVDTPQLKAEIALSLGSIRYNNADYATSIENFELVVAQQNIEVLTLEKGYWFLGNTYFQLDRLDEAKQAFNKAFELNGAYSRVAKTYVDALSNISE